MHIFPGFILGYNTLFSVNYCFSSNFDHLAMILHLPFPPSFPALIFFSFVFFYLLSCLVSLWMIAGSSLLTFVYPVALWYILICSPTLPSQKVVSGLQSNSLFCHIVHSCCEWLAAVFQIYGPVTLTVILIFAPHFCYHFSLRAHSPSMFPILPSSFSLLWIFRNLDMSSPGFLTLASIFSFTYWFNQLSAICSGNVSH